MTGFKDATASSADCSVFALVMGAIISPVVEVPLVLVLTLVLVALVVVVTAGGTVKLYCTKSRPNTLVLPTPSLVMITVCVTLSRWERWNKTASPTKLLL